MNKFRKALKWLHNAFHTIDACFHGRTGRVDIEHHYELPKYIRKEIEMDEKASVSKPIYISNPGSHRRTI